jgi:hypothetical protein
VLFHPSPWVNYRDAEPAQIGLLAEEARVGTCIRLLPRRPCRENDRAATAGSPY